VRHPAKRHHLVLGRQRLGQLGDGTTTNQPRATQMPNFLGATMLTAGDAHTCARMSDSTVRCWGRGTEGQLGNAIATSYTPVPVYINTSNAP
jgi:alpha-tubulin suppressor-like RCC1 family protein